MHVSTCMGLSVASVSEASAGDIVALAGVDCESGVTFTDGKAKVTSGGLGAVGSSSKPIGDLHIICMICLT